MREKPRKNSFDEWLGRSLASDPALAARVAKRLAEMRIEQDLVALRERRGLTQAQLGKMLGISQPAVAKMEAEGGNLEIKTLARAAEVLDARLEIRLTPFASPGESRSSRSRSLARRRPYARSAVSHAYSAGAVAPTVVHDPAVPYGTPARGTAVKSRSSAGVVASRKKR